MRKDNEVRYDMIQCPECNCLLRKDNFGRHLARVHPERVPGSDPGSFFKEDRIGMTGTSREPMHGSRREMGMLTTGERKMRLAKRRKQRLSLLVGTSLTILIIGLLVGYHGMFREGDHQEATQVMPTGTGDIRILRSELSQDARFYSFNSTGIDIRFFGVVGSDGEERFAFDACEACYAYKKGYSQTDRNMRCNNCGMEFPITGLGKDNREDGCWPNYLPFSEDGEDIIVLQHDLVEKRYLFE